MSLAEEIVRLPAPPPPAPEQPRQRLPKRDPRAKQRRQVVAAVSLGAIWCMVAAGGIWVANRHAQANQVAKDITELQGELRAQAARNLDFQAQIVERSNQEYVGAWAKAHGMHQPTAAQLKMMPVDKAQVNSKAPVVVAQAALPQPTGGVFGWLGSVFQSVKGALSAHK